MVAKIYLSSGATFATSLGAVDTQFPNPVWKYGYFNGGLISGTEYGNEASTGSSTGAAYVAESGATNLSINLGTQKLSGDLDNLEIGRGLNHSTSNFSLNQTNVRIEDIGTTSTSTVTSHAVLNGLQNGDLSGLYAQLAITGTEQHGTAGNEGFLAFAGNDTFVFQPTFGTDRITGFTAGASTDDTIRLLLSDANYDTFAEVYSASTQIGANTEINLGAHGTIVLEGVNRTDLHADDFLFV